MKTYSSQATSSPRPEADLRQPPPESQQDDPLRFALRYKWLLAAGCAVGLLLGQLAYMVLGPVYQASAKILVSKKVPAALNNEQEGRTWGGRSEHIALIMSPMIVGEAVKNHRLGQRPSLAQSKTPAEDIIDDLRVKRIAGRDRSFLNVFKLTYRNPIPEDAEAILKAIIEAYDDYLAETRKQNTQEAVRLISKAKQDLHQQLQETQQKYLEFRKNAPLHWERPPGAEDAAGAVINIHQQRIETIEAERRQNLVQQAAIKSKIKAIERARQEDEPRRSLELMVRQFMQSDSQETGSPSGARTGQETRQALDQKLLPLLLKEKRLLRDFGADHPEVEAVRQSIQTLRRFYRRQGLALPKRGPSSSSGTSASPQVDLVAVYLRSLQRRLEALQLRNAELDDLYQQETRLAKKFAHYQAKDQTLHEELQRVKSLWQATVKRLEELTLTKQTNGYTMRQIAPVGKELDFKRHLKFLGGGFLAGFTAMAGLAYFWQWWDTRVKSVDEVRSLLKMPVLGAIPEFPTARLENSAEPVHASLCYWQQPNSPAAEAYRAIRTALAISESHQSRVLQVTSPELGDGKTTLAANLALAMAQSGRNVLLIDADLRRPTVHSLFAARHEIGLSEVLAGDIDMPEAVQPMTIEGLSLLSAGASVSNPAERLASPRLRRSLSEARQQYDLVLIDAPPLLAVSDPCTIIPHVDGVLLVVRMAKNKQAVLRRCQELLQQHGAHVLGFIANEVTSAWEEAYAYSGQSAQQEPPEAATLPKEPDRRETIETG